MPFVKRVVRSVPSLLALSALLAAPAHAQVLVQDSNFVGADWTTYIDRQSGNASFTVRQETSGGNPGSYRRIILHLPTNTEVTFHNVFLGATFDPRRQGAIDHLDISEDRRVISPAGAEFASVPIVLQDGSFFFGPYGIFTNTSWQTHRWSGLTASNFSNGTRSPDFSAAGGPIRFGSWRGSSNIGANLTLDSGWDNWSVTITCPEPGCDTPPAPDLAITKSATPTTIGGSPAMLYELSFANLGDREATGVTLFENVPLLTVFSEEASDPGWLCAPPGQYFRFVGGGSCSLAIGSLAPGASGRRFFAARTGATVLTPPAGFDVFNEVSVFDDGENGADKDESDNEAAVVTPDTGCADLSDPIRYLICVFRAQRAPATAGWLRRFLSSARNVVGDLLLYYRLRDRFFLPSAGGRQTYQTYRTHSPEVRALLESDATLRNAALALLADLETPLRELAAGRGDQVLFSQQMANDVTALAARLNQIGSPALRAQLSTSRLSSFVGRPMTAMFRSYLDQRACVSSDTTLCLNGGRFRVEAHWRDFAGNRGVGRAVPLTSDTGYFWFFSAQNVELVVKALDGRAFNGRYWLFYGALSNVEYVITVNDTVTGAVKVYDNAAGEFGSVGDAAAFLAGADPVVPAAAPLAEEESLHAESPAQCAPTATALCLNGPRFRVEVSWRDFAGNTGVGRAVTVTSDTGYFWFFSAQNVELVVKALDGRAFNDRFWLFYGALSNVEYTITVTDTVTGAVKTYFNPSGNFGSVGDANAFVP